MLVTFVKSINLEYFNKFIIRSAKSGDTDWHDQKLHASSTSELPDDPIGKMKIRYNKCKCKGCRMEVY